MFKSLRITTCAVLAGLLFAPAACETGKSSSKTETSQDDDDDFYDDDDEMMVMTIANADDCIGCVSCARVCPKNCHTHEALAG